IEDEHVRFLVRDSGKGIAPENLDRVFTHGFTTRPDGHGFGLHSAANAATQLGGSLRCSSPGEGRGAEFVLEVPRTILEEVA
ncbi:MAG: ATP-binding protein, partial [Myxococcota bacterium]